MATIGNSDPAWWRYAVEFARRGLWPLGDIETHGPHEAPADRVWGEAYCAADDRSTWEVEFVGPAGCAGYGDLRGLRMYEKDNPETGFPVLRERGERSTRWLRYARKRAH